MLGENMRNFFTTAANPESPRQSFQLPAELVPSEDLTQLAQTEADGASSPFAAAPVYDGLFEAIARVLHRRRSHHVWLSGERGVGKTTVLVELARRVASGAIPTLRGQRVLYVDCRYLAPQEGRQRLELLLALLAKEKDVIACLDGVASLLHNDDGRDSRAVLLANLPRASCRLIVLLTPREFEDTFADDPDFHDFFERVEVAEPDPDTALALLCHFAVGLQRLYSVRIDDEAIRQAVILSAHYVFNDHLPAKALRLLHRACEDVDYQRVHRGDDRACVRADDLIHAVAQTSGVPEATLRGVADRTDYEHNLGAAIVGQQQAVRAVADELGLIKAGMTDPNKPASVLLFLGQTGTGKTEMAKVLARLYSTSKRLKTYTLGNCIEPHSVATIIGVPPGYVGNDQGGRLVNELNADPYGVFLLDEDDKAHPDVLQPFLNLFDEGWISDQRGVKAHAHKSIFILTTNVGQRMIADLNKQGKSPEGIGERMKEALSQIRHGKSNRPVFTPEFLARIKRIILFNPLDRAAMHGICRKLLADIARSWQERRCKTLKVAAELLDYIADRAQQLNDKAQGKEGGRIVRKLIAELVESTLQHAIAERSAEYRASDTAALDFAPPTGNSGPAIAVRFLSAGEQPR